jgi:hypothetical protein
MTTTDRFEPTGWLLMRLNLIVGPHTDSNANPQVYQVCGEFTTVKNQQLPGIP